MAGEREYTIADGAGSEVEDNGTRIKPVTESDTLVTSVTPGGLSVEDVENGSQVTVKGKNFVEGMHISIGMLELQNVQVTGDSTLTGTLKGSMSAGSYSVRAQYPDGRIGVAQ